MTRVLRLTPDGTAPIERTLAIERPVAVEVNGIGYAVMMATPADLDVFAIGFMLTERLIDGIGDVLDHEAIDTAQGVILRITLAPHCAERIADRVRHRTSDTGCGLCGIANLENLSRRTPHASRPTLRAASIFASLARMRDHQPLNRETGAVHAAAYCNGDGTIEAAFEDVGRHNALDKLIGALARDAVDVAAGFILVTSRLSFEIVDKALISGATALVGISAPTTMALDHARAHGLTLIALARSDAVLVLNDPHALFGDIEG